MDESDRAPSTMSECSTSSCEFSAPLGRAPPPACSRLEFQLYAVNRLPFIKASCRSLEGELRASDGSLFHPFVAFFSSFARAKAAACWLSEAGEEVYVHRFRANKIVEAKWHPAKPGQTHNHPTQMCHYSAAGVAFRDWPVAREAAPDGRSGLDHRQPMPAFLVGVNTQPQEEPQWRHFSFFTVGVFTSEERARAAVARRPRLAGRVSVWPVQLNAPLRPCLGSLALSAQQTRLLVRGAMIFVEQHEDWQAQGGELSHVMGQICSLVLDGHRHPPASSSSRRRQGSVSLQQQTERGPASMEAADAALAAAICVEC